MSDAAPGAPDADVAAALAVLGKRRLVLAIHDSSFPGDGRRDADRGTPYSAAALEFVGFVRRLGFDSIMLGPQGMPSRDNPSPYDATLFSRNMLNIDYPSLARDPRLAWLVDEDVTAPGAADRPDRVRHAAAWDASHRALARAHGALRQGRARGDARAVHLDAMLGEFRRAQRDWLEADALWFALAERHGGAHHRDWRDAAALSPALRRELEAGVERHALGQLLVHHQHAALRAGLASVGLRLYGDFQIGLSPCDEWRREHLFLTGYRLGAPPSRTNPDGQPWGYRLLDPARYVDSGGAPGPAMRFLAMRVGKLLDECDGLRVDHPHGLVCPWVYRAGARDEHAAVRAGARLFASPDLPDHPELARYAIARREQLASDSGLARHADGWVRDLDDAQLDRYGRLLSVLVDAVRERGGGAHDLVCEVLSTCPYPLARLMQRHGLGRFRVTQKADVHDPDDVYRSENARPEDWIMVATHDTPPIWQLVREWAGTGTGRDRAHYLAHRLRPDGGAESLAATLATDSFALAQACFADAFASRASHVLVFFADLLGVEATYNRPGTVSEENWALRVPSDYARRYAAAIARGAALDLPRVLALALRARGRATVEANRDLVARLERRGR